ncbi:MAG: GvpL/GvpF family gas vesicle protein [Bacteroidota bacterium]
MNELIYVYGVTPNDNCEIAFNNLSALYEYVPESEFGEGSFQNNLQNTEWLTEKALAHQTTLEQAAKEKIVIPFKFGSIFKSADNVVQMLKEKHQQFELLLEKLREREEWGIKLFYESTSLTSWIEEHHETITQLNTELKNSTPGKAFLLKKQYETKIREAVKAEINAVRQQLYTEIQTLTDHFKLEKETDRSLTREKGINTLNLPILIQKTKVDQVQTLVENYRKNYGERGFSLELTGPWPPYNFVD